MSTRQPCTTRSGDQFREATIQADGKKERLSSAQILKQIEGMFATPLSSEIIMGIRVQSKAGKSIILFLLQKVAPTN
jgi:hypothetical protein